MGLTSPTYQSFRSFLREQMCEEAFDLAFLLHNGHTALDAALWEAGEAEYIFAHAFDWATTPDGRDYWQKIDKEWNKLIYGK